MKCLRIPLIQGRSKTSGEAVFSRNIRWLHCPGGLIWGWFLPLYLYTLPTYSRVDRSC